MQAKVPRPSFDDERVGKPFDEDEEFGPEDEPEMEEDLTWVEEDDGEVFFYKEDPFDKRKRKTEDKLRFSMNFSMNMTED